MLVDYFYFMMNGRSAVDSISRIDNARQPKNEFAPIQDSM